jgi:hypothetical protein
MATDFPADPDHRPSTWKLLRKSGGGITATFTCPNGHTGSLEGHDIAADGTLLQSVVCMASGCGFHDWIRLASWRPDA